MEGYHAGTVRSYLAANANETVEAYGVNVSTITDVSNCPRIASAPA